jgi:hypothetical protein
MLERTAQDTRLLGRSDHVWFRGIGEKRTGSVGLAPGSVGLAPGSVGLAPGSVGLAQSRGEGPLRPENWITASDAGMTRKLRIRPYPATSTTRGAGDVAIVRQTSARVDVRPVTKQRITFGFACIAA